MLLFIVYLIITGIRLNLEILIECDRVAFPRFSHQVLPECISIVCLASENFLSPKKDTSFPPNMKQREYTKNST